jgi:hypothetical protein
MNKFIISESERSEILKKHSTYKQYLVENVTNYSLQDLQTVLQTKLGLSLGKSGVDGKFGKMTKAAIIQGLDMVKNQVNPVVPVETIKTTEGTPEGTPGGTPGVTVDPTKDGGANTANANTANANTEGSKEETTDSATLT